MSRPVVDEKEELEFLRWIYGHLDFGPAHEDVMDSLREEFEAEVGRQAPAGYRKED